MSHLASDYRIKDPFISERGLQASIVPDPYATPSFAKASDRQAIANLPTNKPLWLNKSMYYAYILYSSSTKKLYTGYSPDIKNRLTQHNTGQNQSTKHGIPWKLVWYAGFESKKKAIDFEQYLKSGSGKAFLYKRFVDEALKKDVDKKDLVVPKPSYIKNLEGEGPLVVPKQ